MNEELLGYVRQQLSLKVPKDVIAGNLKGSGWTDADISEVFSALEPKVVPLSSIPVSPISSTVSGTLPHTGHKKIISIVFILILLGVAGAAVYAYQSGVFVSLPKLLADSFEKTETAKTYSHNFSFEADFSGLKDLDDASNPLSSLGIIPKEFKLSMYGSSDMSDKNNLKTSSVISINMNPISAGAEMRLVGDMFYARLTQLPTLSVLPIPMLSEYKDKWFSFPYNLSQSGINETQFTAEQQQYLAKMFRDAHIIKPVSKVATETVDGVSTYHFSFILDKDALASFMKSMVEYLKSIREDESQFSDAEEQELNEGLEAIKDFKGEVWIGRNDKLMRKITISFGIVPDPAKDEQVKIKMMGLMTNWNEPVSILAPAESTPFQTLIEASLGEARQKGAEASIKANMSNMRVQAEIFWDKTSKASNGYNGSYAGLCKSSELKTTKQAVEDQGGTGFVCKDTVKAYIIYTKLGENSDYWCVDSTGDSTEIATLPSALECR